MYQSFFQFAERPFIAAPLPERYFPTETTEQARKNLVRAIERAEGPGLIIGAAGFGKTLLCHVLAGQCRGKFHVAMLASAGFRTRRALLQNISLELGLPCRGMDEDELRLSLMDYLAPRPERPNGVLLLVDEAHTLSVRLLEEMRLITNLVCGGQPRVRLVLAGCPLLEEHLANPRLESLSQRLAARCYLQSLNREETCAYVRAQISAAGGRPAELFTDDALEAIHRASDGIPRLINQVCDHALVLAAGCGKRRIDAACVQEAWSDLQQLPAPCHSPVRKAAAEDGGVVEFGQLEDDQQDAAPAQAARAAQSWSSDAQDHEPSDEPSDECSELCGRLDEIELKVAELEDEAACASGGESTCAGQPQPTGGGVPEVELVFHNVQDPFGDAFEEEEVVIDRYALLQAGSTHRWPLVSSPESREFAAAVLATGVDGARSDPACSEDPAPDAAPAAVQGEEQLGVEGAAPAADPIATESPGPGQAKKAPEENELVPSNETSATHFSAESPPQWLLTLHDAGAAEDDDQFDPASDPVMPEYSGDDSGPCCSVAVEGPAEHLDAAASEAGAARSALSGADEDDRDIIVVVEGEQEAMGRVAEHVSIARPREYRHLFAKLRHG